MILLKWVAIPIIFGICMLYIFLFFWESSSDVKTNFTYTAKIQEKDYINDENKKILVEAIYLINQKLDESKLEKLGHKGKVLKKYISGEKPLKIYVFKVKEFSVNFPFLQVKLSIPSDLNWSNPLPGMRKIWILQKNLDNIKIRKKAIETIAKNETLILEAVKNEALYKNNVYYGVYWSNRRKQLQEENQKLGKELANTSSDLDHLQKDILHEIGHFFFPYKPDALPFEFEKLLK